MENSLLYGSIVVGLSIVGYGVTYVIDFERRISVLEIQSVAISRLNSEISLQQKGESVNDSSSERPVSISGSEFDKALANSCAQLVTSFEKIISQGYIYSAEREQIDALTVQMSSLGCYARGSLNATSN